MPINFLGKYLRITVIVIFALTFILNAIFVIGDNSPQTPSGVSGGGGGVYSAPPTAIAPPANSNIPWSQSFYGDIVVPVSIPSPQVLLDKKAYSICDSVYASVYVEGIPSISQTNSMTTTFTYDNTAFELETGNIESSANYKLASTIETISVNGTATSVIFGYYSTTNNIELPKGDMTLLTVKLKVKRDAVDGYHIFNTEVKAIDMNGNYILYSNQNTTNRSILVAKNMAKINGCYSIYLGEGYNELNKLIVKNIKPNEINSLIKRISINLTPYYIPYGEQNNYFASIQPEKNGDLYHLSSDGRVIVNFSIPVMSENITNLKICGDSYNSFGYFTLPKYKFNETIQINNEENPVIIYPGDISSSEDIFGRPYIQANSRDDKIDADDFFTWYYNYVNDFNGSNYQLRLWNPQLADFTRDGKIDNVDFSLWLASSKMFHLKI